MNKPNESERRFQQALIRMNARGASTSDIQSVLSRRRQEHAAQETTKMMRTFDEILGEINESYGLEGRKDSDDNVDVGWWCS